jgi:hypothetical protein
MTDILALDIATSTGWARGRPEDAPTCGSVRFASKGASHGAIFSGAFDWFREFTEKDRPDVLVIEDLLPFRAKMGETTKDTARLLAGLHGVIRLVAFKREIFKVQAVPVSDVRHHFIGGNFKREQAKGYVEQKCKSLGWLERADTDAADACALWSYWAARVVPETALRVSPLFQARRRA